MFDYRADILEVIHIHFVYNLFITSLDILILYQKLAEIFKAIESSEKPVNMNIREFRDYFYILYKLFDLDLGEESGREEIFQEIIELGFTISIGKATYKYGWCPAMVDGLDNWFKEYGKELIEEE